jgi:hypothetical protein
LVSWRGGGEREGAGGADEDERLRCGLEKIKQRRGRLMQGRWRWGAASTATEGDEHAPCVRRKATRKETWSSSPKLYGQGEKKKVGQRGGMRLGQGKTKVERGVGCEGERAQGVARVFPFISIFI